MLPTLSDQQQRAIALQGTPLPMFDPVAKRGYVLLEVAFTNADPDGVQATIPGISVLAEGETPTDALTALAVVLSKFL